MWIEKCKLVLFLKVQNLSALPQSYKDLISHVDKNGSYIWEYSIYPVAVIRMHVEWNTRLYVWAEK